MNPAPSSNSTANIRRCGMTPDATFPKKERLIKTKDFRGVYKSGGSFKADAFVLKITPNALPLNRIGFSISSKSVKKAFRRNRIRRLFREAYRKNKKDLKKGFDMVLLTRRDPGEKFCYENARSIFLNLARKAGVMS